MENTELIIPAPSDPLKKHKSHFSKIGLFYFCGAIIISGVQISVITLIQLIAPQLMVNPNISLIISSLSMYLIAMPLLVIIVRTIPGMVIGLAYLFVFTGTPLQNHLAEIWALFEIAVPGLLGSFNRFTDRFVLPIERDKDREQQRLLKRLVSPFILRRTKTDVLNELPEKTEMTVKVELAAEEKALYEELREETQVSLENGEINAMQALTSLMRLRQAACSAELIDPALTIPSSKTQAFLKLADELIENRHRALVFSQFTSHLALIRRALDEKGIKYLYLDGSMSPAQRMKLVEAFENGEMPLFLISLKAGGTGLNLTAADYVIHMDPWWNPAIENQASDRAYRIGQERPVTIYRLIAAGTVEEKILKLHATKKSLADALLEGTEMSSRLGREEIMELLSLAK